MSVYLCMSSCLSVCKSVSYLRDGEGWAPVILEDVKTNLSLAVDVAVVDSGLEGHLDNTSMTLELVECHKVAY